MEEGKRKERGEWEGEEKGEEVKGRAGKKGGEDSG